MPKLTVTNFSNRAGSPFKGKETGDDKTVVHNEVLRKTHYEKQKEKQNELLQKVNKKTADYQANKPSSGVFTEVVTHGAFTVKATGKDKLTTSDSANTTASCKVNNVTNGSKSLLGFPSSANDLALDAKSDLESDANISEEVKEKVINKLFTLVSMVQHVYESKVRVMTEFDKFKDTHLRNESRREREHSEQLYKLNINFQNEVVQAMQRLKSELDISKNVTKDLKGSETSLKDSSADFYTSDDAQDSDSAEKTKEANTENDTEQAEVGLKESEVV